MQSFRRKVVLCCVGTRPEVIKMAPVIAALNQDIRLKCRVLVTAQHRQMLDQALAFFDLHADFDLDAMRENQTLAGLTSRLLVELDRVFTEYPPDLVVAQGDTTTVLATALASFYRRIPFAHLEAGLRTFQRFAPFPEETNRVLASRMSDLHFAPTPAARDNLLNEGIAPQTVLLTGNTVIDALFAAVKRRVPIGVELDPNKRFVLVTAHRRDSFGEPIRHICDAVLNLRRTFPDIEFLWPVHPNPSVRPVVQGLVGDQPGIHLCEPLAYGSFVSALDRCHLVLTDSGGVQEEAPALGKPVLVMRDQSERPEAIAAGVAKLVGANRDDIFREASHLLTDPIAYRRMSVGGSPYGDGQAAGRVALAIANFFGFAAERLERAA